MIDREISRRRALAKLGLTSAVAYVALNLVQIDRALAKTKPSQCKHPPCS